MELPILTHKLLLEVGRAEASVRVAIEKRQAAVIAIGMQMRMRRHSVGMSIEELAKQMECSPSYLGQMEQGKREFTELWVRRAERWIQARQAQNQLKQHE